MWSEQLWMLEPAPVPDPPPLWPLPGVPTNYWVRSQGYKRPFSCDNDEIKCERWHVGIDLAGGRAGGAEAVACETCTVISTSTWKYDTHVVFVRNHTSKTLATYGGLQTPLPKPGTELAAGARIGTMGTAYTGLHFELYEDDGSRTRPNPWFIGKDPPSGLLSPVNYVQAAAGDPQTRETVIQRHDALRRLEVYAGPVRAPWVKASTDALVSAQKLLGLDADGVWGPQTEQAITRALQVMGDDPNGTPQPVSTSTPLPWVKIAVGVSVAAGVILWGRIHV